MSKTFCSQCGNAVGEGELFCANCGQKVEELDLKVPSVTGENLTKKVVPPVPRQEQVASAPPVQPAPPQYKPAPPVQLAPPHQYEPAPTMYQDPNQYGKKNNSKVILGIVGGLLLVLIAVSSIFMTKFFKEDKPDLADNSPVKQEKNQKESNSNEASVEESTSQIKINNKAKLTSADFVGKWQMTFLPEASEAEDMGEAIIYHKVPVYSAMMVLDPSENSILELSIDGTSMEAHYYTNEDGVPMEIEIKADLKRENNLYILEGEILGKRDSQLYESGKFYAEKINFDYGYEYALLDTEKVEGIESLDDTKLAEGIIIAYLTDLRYNDISRAMSYISPEYFAQNGFYLFNDDYSKYFLDFNIISSKADSNGVWVEVTEDWNSGPETKYYHVKIDKNSRSLIDAERYKE